MDGLPREEQGEIKRPMEGVKQGQKIPSFCIPLEQVGFCAPVGLSARHLHFAKLAGALFP